MEENLKVINIGLESMEDGFTKDIILGSLDTMMGFLELQRLQIIWINALREGMMEIESRLEK